MTPSRIQETWEKMRPENRYAQMTPSERVAFALSEEGKNYLFPWGFTVDGKNNNDRIWDGEFSYIPMIKWSDFINDVNHQIERVEKIRDRADEYELHIDVDQ